MVLSETHSDYTGYCVSCNGETDGFIDVTVSGGAGGYTYEWSNGAMDGATSEDLSEEPVRDMVKHLAQDYLMNFD